jgi:trehalose synthase
VAEPLESLVPYARGAGVDARWLVVEGPQEFFDITKRIHNWLHGNIGDGGPLDQEAREIYEQALSANAATICERVREGDVAIVHDPRPAGLIGALRDAGAAAIWRCYVGRHSVADREWGKRRARRVHKPRSLLDYLAVIDTVLERRGIRVAP